MREYIYMCCVYIYLYICVWVRVTSTTPNYDRYEQEHHDTVRELLVRTRYVW